MHQICRSARSAVGQTATSTDASPKSALPPKADILRRGRHVRKVPIPEVGRLELLMGELINDLADSFERLVSPGKARGSDD